MSALKAALDSAEQAGAAAQGCATSGARGARQRAQTRRSATSKAPSASRSSVSPPSYCGVRDSLELAGQNAATADAQSLAAGQQATLQLLAKAFEKSSIQRLDPLGAPFDPDAARGGHGPGAGQRTARLRAAGAAVGLSTERAPAAPGARDRRARTAKWCLNSGPAAPALVHALTNYDISE